MASDLSKILQQEYKTKGVVGGISSALGKKAKEKLDIRNALFGGSGLGSILGKKVFGKGYSAIGSDRPAKELNQETSSLLTSQTGVLNKIGIASEISAKNSMSLPAIASQMNIMQKNIAKLVKIQGVTPSTKADSFFSSAKFRENAYESKYNKSNNVNQPTKIEDKPKEGSSGILGLIGSLAGGLISAVGNITKGFGNAVSGVGTLLGGIGVAALGLAGVFGRILRFFIKSPIGRLLGLAGIAVGLANRNSNTETTDTSNLTPTEEGTDTNKQVNPLTKTLVNTVVLPVGGVLAGNSLLKGGLGAANAVKGTSDAILDARTISQASIANSKPTTFWGKFLKYVATRSPMLFQKVGVKLAQATALATIPIIGWISAAISLGFGLWTAWELYELWKEYNNIPEEKEGSTNTQTVNTSPTPETPVTTTNAPGTSPTSPSSMPATGTDYNTRIGAGESGGKYDTVFGKAGGAMINGKPITQNTIAEVVAWQKSMAGTNKQAAGKYQFMNVGAAAKRAGLSNGDLFNGPNQERMMAAYTQGNADALKRLGLEATPENLSMSHAVGVGGTKKLLDAQKFGMGEANSLGVLGLNGNAAKTNPQLNTSVNNTIARLSNKVKGTGSPSPMAPSESENVALAGNNPLSEMLSILGPILQSNQNPTPEKVTQQLQQPVPVNNNDSTASVWNEKAFDLFFKNSTDTGNIRT